MTPSELKYLHETNDPGSYYFSRSTMKFFGDTMRNYGVRDAGKAKVFWDEAGENYLPEGRIVEVWELYRKRAVNGGQRTSTYFDKATGKVHRALEFVSE